MRIFSNFKYFKVSCSSKVSYISMAIDLFSLFSLMAAKKTSSSSRRASLMSSISFLADSMMLDWSAELPIFESFSLESPIRASSSSIIATASAKSRGHSSVNLPRITINSKLWADRVSLSCLAALRIIEICSISTVSLALH